MENNEHQAVGPGGTDLGASDKEMSPSIHPVESAIDESDPAQLVAPEWRPYVDRVAARLSGEQGKPISAVRKKRRRSARVLVVDDDTGTCDLLATALHGVGVVCDLAHAGAEAIARIEQQTYDVVVVDLVLPDLNGLEVVHTLRQRSSAARVIIITGFGDIETAIEALHARADDYIQKPIKVEEFLASVERSLGRQETLRDIRLTHQQMSQQLSALTLGLQRRFTGGVVALATALEARDPYTKGHSSRVANMCVAVGRALGFHRERLDDLVVGALLHDIGKIAVPDAVLLKDDALGQEEFDKIKRHPRVGYDILIPFFGRSIVTECALYHHERWNGSGYPSGVAGEQLSLVGRIIALCDAFDAMTSKRPYRGALSECEALKEIEKNRGKQFDPEIADLFCAIHPYQSLHQEPERGGRT